MAAILIFFLVAIYSGNKFFIVTALLHRMRPLRQTIEKLDELLRLPIAVILINA